MSADTKNIIISKARQLFAMQGYEGFSMRTLAEECGVGLSSIYHFFGDKDEILHAIFKQTSRNLGLQRAKLPKRRLLQAMLADRIRFQFQHIEEVVFVLKYYLHFRQTFEKNMAGYVPHKAYLHIEEVLQHGIDSGQLSIEANDLEKEAKIITHAINGFLLEYYPANISNREITKLSNDLTDFIMRSISKKEVVNM